jgi:hypothetical protein
MALAAMDIICLELDALMEDRGLQLPSYQLDSDAG